MATKRMDCNTVKEIYMKKSEKKKKNFKFGKNKAFTLIELLSVIVVLAIIALISVPLVLKYINDSKLHSFTTTVHNISDAVNYYVAEKELKNETLAYPEVVDVKDLNLKNKDRLSGTVSIYKENDGVKFSYNNITNGEFIVNGDNESNSILNTKDVENPILKALDDDIVVDNYKHYIYGINSINDVPNLFTVQNGSLEFEQLNSFSYSTGTKLHVKDKNGIIYQTFEIVSFGDINGDTVIDVLDAADVQKYTTNKKPSEIEIFCVDFNNNGAIDQEDFDFEMDLVIDTCTVNQQNKKITC